MKLTSVTGLQVAAFEVIGRADAEVDMVKRVVARIDEGAVLEQDPKAELQPVPQ